MVEQSTAATRSLSEESAALAALAAAFRVCRSNASDAQKAPLDRAA
jgi:hypothetical protein